MNSKLIILVIIGLAFLFPTVSAAYGYYTIPVMAITNSPADNVRNYIGNRPIAPSITINTNKVHIPTTGVIERVEIYDYSGTAGTNEAYTYYIQINGDIAKNYLIQTKSVNTNERIFTNSALNIAVTAGDYFEINRTHPVNWATNPLTNTVGGYVAINATTEPGYVYPFMHPTASPADAAWNYFGFRPVGLAAAGTANDYIYELKSPAAGNITKAYIYDYSGTAGTNEAISYYAQVNEGTENLIQTQTLAASERIFSNTGLNIPVETYQSIKLKRQNPTWGTNPLTNTIGASYFINTQYQSSTVARGYPLFVQTISASPADTTPFYFGNSPITISTTAGTNKIYIPKSGTINRAYISFYATTLGTAEVSGLYIRKNNAQDYMVESVGSMSLIRVHDNRSIGMPVSAGDYIEIKVIPPAWATNPVGHYSGYVFIDYTTPEVPGGGGDIILPPVADFSANLTGMLSPATVQFFDQSNNTVPNGATAYYWNFTDGGTKVDSTDINPTFAYTTSGSKTVNHTVVSGGVTSKISKTVTLTAAGVGASLPIAKFKLVLTDTSTQYPTAWKWNKTSLLGDNIETTFSTAQNPDFSFPTGNYKINLTVTNAFGSNTTNQTIGYNLSSPKVYFWSRTA